jgi:hypothetical protein
MVESSAILYDSELIALNRGGPASVEFDFEAAWATRKRPNYEPWRLTWLHVHPVGFGPGASQTDLNCARGLKAAFGRCQNFGILHFKDTRLNNIDGDILWHWMEGDELEADLALHPIESTIHRDVAYMMKALAVAK